jgi:hypothetical protein
MTPGPNDEAFDRLYTEHAAALLGFLTYQTGDRALAEDIVADTFERVLTARSGWRGQSGEKTWLYTIAMNRLRDLARRRAAESRALDRVAALPIGRDDLGAVGDHDLLQRALQTLSDEERVGDAFRRGSVAARDRGPPGGAPEHRRGTSVPRATTAARCRHVEHAEKDSAGPVKKRVARTSNG